MPNQPSVSFDRAADYYDATRGLPEHVKTQVIDILVRELDGREPILEIGVGTGRIGLPLVERGVELIGVDLSEPMLRRLIANAGGSSPLPLCLADATRLPLRSKTFGAVLTCHVLHLIPNWATAISEFVRVLRPGGLYLNEIGGWQELAGPRLDLMTRFASEAAFELKAQGIDDVSEVDGVMASHGATARGLPVVMLSESNTYEKTIADLESGTWSCTWQASEDARVAAGRRTRQWAARRYGDLSQVYEYSAPLQWRAYELP